MQNQVTGAWGGVPEVGAYYRDHGIGWVVIGDENYGASRGFSAVESRSGRVRRARKLTLPLLPCSQARARPASTLLLSLASSAVLPLASLHFALARLEGPTLTRLLSFPSPPPPPPLPLYSHPLVRYVHLAACIELRRPS